MNRVLFVIFILVLFLPDLLLLHGPLTSSLSDRSHHGVQTRLVLFKQKITQGQIKRIQQLRTVKKIRVFSPYRSDYFSRLYSLLIDTESLRWSDDWNHVKTIAPVESIETPGKVYPLAIRPSLDALPMTQDPLIGFQWALDSNGQEIILPKGTLIDSEYIPAVPGADLKIKGIIGELEAKVKRDLVVAVVDFGLDYNLPDIVNGIAYNAIECDMAGTRYKNPFQPTEDRDGNGYKGDCLGWNFTSEEEEEKLEGNNNPMDAMGHGTHIAGIIAAERNNNIGISGISSKLKVLPIKVMYREQGKKSSFRGGSFTDKVAKGILYAITRKVDVINLSLGWPSSLDHQHIRRAIREAIRQGIMVVAAAGNNKNNRPIAPCSYPEVVCVGASRADKRVASFSNFGAHVDVVAPGDHILSLFPLSVYNKDRSSIFNFPGYEIAGGTSQAAPHVAAVMALLKGALGIDVDEVKARLFSSAEALPHERGMYFRDGLIHTERAYRFSPRPVLRPEFKDLEKMVINPQNRKLDFPLTIKNYWAKSHGFKVKVSSLSPHVVMSKSEFELTALDKGETHVIRLVGRVAKHSPSHVAKLSVTLVHQEELWEYPFEFILAQELDGYENLRQVAIHLDSELKWVMDRTLELNIPISPFRTITDFKKQSRVPEYYFESRTKEGIQLKIWRWVGEGYRLIKEIPLPSEGGNRPRVLTFHRDDFEGDGQAEYVIRSGYIKKQKDKDKQKEEEKEAVVHYTFLDSQFNPYYGPRHSTWELNVVSNKALILQQRVDKLKFIGFSPPEDSVWNREKVWVPIFIQTASLPKVDRNPSVFALPDHRGFSRINFLIPEISQQGPVVLKQRVFNGYQRREQFTEQLKLFWKDRLVFLSFLNSRAHEVGLSVRVLMAVIKEDRKDYYILTLSGQTLPVAGKWDFVDVQITPLGDESGHGEVFNLVSNQVYSSIKIDPSRSSYHFYHSDVFFAPFSEQMARVALLDPSSFSIRKKSIIKQKNFREKIRRFIQSFEVEDQFYTFIESNNFLTLLKTQGYSQTEITTVPLIRFSFVPGYILRENVQPIVVREGSHWRPAIYVDSSHITSQYLYSWVFSEGRLFSPLQLSVSLPSHCRVQDISPWDQGFAYVFLCFDDHNNRWWFKFLPAEL